MRTTRTDGQQKAPRRGRPGRALRLAVPAGLGLLALGLAAACLRPVSTVSPHDRMADEPVRRGAEGRAENPLLAQMQGRFAAYLAAAPGAYGGSSVAERAIWADLLRFYEERSYLPAWFDGLTPRPQTLSLLAARRRLESRPPGPAYPVAELERQLELHFGAPSVEGAYELDLAFTRVYLATASELLNGRLQPRTAGVPWDIPPRWVDLAAHLEQALAAYRIEASLEDLEPSHDQVRRLEAQYRRYRRIAAAGGWPEVPGGPGLAAGDAASPERIRALTHRLAAEGYPVAVPDPAAAAEPRGPEPASSYSAEIAGAVREFQRDHGLEPDGKLGPATLAALNVPAAARLRQIEVNLERWRWLPAEAAPRSVVVNIPAYRLEVVERGRSVLTLRVMVGRESWPTPIFAAPLEVAVLNPAWNVPASIASREILPRLQADPGHLAAENLVAYAGWEGPPVAAGEIELAAWRRNPAAYRLRQPPGPDNPLGRVKFLFPNRFNVYLHDTTARSLFARADRALSHGCVRVEEPFRLAEALFGEDPQWGGGRLQQAALAGEQRAVRVPGRIPVSLVYFTAHVREDGRIEFYRDVYGIDAAMIRALDARRREAPAGGYTPGLRVAFAAPSPPAPGSGPSGLRTRVAAAGVGPAEVAAAWGAAAAGG